jgi:hypothetical protein
MIQKSHKKQLYHINIKFVLALYKARGITSGTFIVRICAKSVETMF